MWSVLHDLLSGLGFAVDQTPGGAEGLAFFRRAGYDLVLTDLAMPGMSGWAVAQAVRSGSTTTPVIAVTGSATDIDARRADALGVTILHKPVPLEELGTAVRQALADRKRRWTAETRTPGVRGRSGGGAVIAVILVSDSSSPTPGW